MIRPPRPGKNTLTKNAYIGNLAVQLINGVNKIVILRSLSLVSVRVAMTAGTVQPNPINNGTMLLPERPILRSSLSITKATRAIYPLSSINDKKKNKVTMIGKKLSTLPTPVNIPSMIKLYNASFSWAAFNPFPTISAIASIPNCNIFCSHAPITLNVR